MAFPAGFARIFTSDEGLINHLIVPARIYAASIGLFGIQIACQQTFTAIGDAKSSLAAAIMRKFILLIPPDLSLAFAVERQPRIRRLSGRADLRLLGGHFHLRPLLRPIQKGHETNFQPRGNDIERRNR
jgi:Na+-driven multidrug efflux pump